MGRRRKAIVFEVPAALQARIEALVPQIAAAPAAQELGVKVDAATVARAALVRGLASLERGDVAAPEPARAPGPGPTRRPAKPARAPAPPAPVFDSPEAMLAAADAAAAADVAAAGGPAVGVATEPSDPTLPPEEATYVDEDGVEHEANGLMLPPPGWGMSSPRERVPAAYAPAHSAYTAAGWRRMWKDDSSGKPRYFYWHPDISKQGEPGPLGGATATDAGRYGVIHLMPAYTNPAIKFGS